MRPRTRSAAFEPLGVKIALDVIAQSGTHVMAALQLEVEEYVQHLSAGSTARWLCETVTRSP